MADRLAIRRQIPAPLKWGLNAAMNLIDPITVAGWRHHHGAACTPIPPRALRARIGGPGLLNWVEEGPRVAAELQALLAGHGRPLESFDSICDFGCGSGRVLSQMPAEPEVQLHGLDVDAEAVAWLRANHPQIDARANSPSPPAPFGARSFDLLWSVSVFTHLSKRSQLAWLAEIARVLEPGGLALLTTFGGELREAFAGGHRAGVTDAQIEILRSAPPLEQCGFIFAPERRSRWNRWRYRGVEDDYGLAFWGHDHIREVFSQWFEVLEIVPAALNWRQDAVLVTPRQN